MKIILKAFKSAKSVDTVGDIRSSSESEIDNMGLAEDDESPNKNNDRPSSKKPKKSSSEKSPQKETKKQK